MLAYRSVTQYIKYRLCTYNLRSGVTSEAEIFPNLLFLPALHQTYR